MQGWHLILPFDLVKHGTNRMHSMPSRIYQYTTLDERFNQYFPIVYGNNEPIITRLRTNLTGSLD